MREGSLIGGRFELERQVGSGGMGDIFRARDRASGGVVAIKVLRDALAGAEARFAREVQVLADLSHPAIVRYIAHGIAPSGRPYLAMEWVEGVDLVSRLARAKLTLDEVVTLASRLAAALAAAHARGVIHRDLKPGNVLLRDGDVAQTMLIDFGVARRGDAAAITRAGMVLGTPGYMAPEQVRGDPRIDARADVFALGCVLFECLTGAPVFSGEHVIAILGKIVFADAPRVREIRPEIPAALDALCARMLSKSPADRPRDGLAVLSAITALESDAAPLSRPPPSSVARAPRPGLTGSERRVISVLLLGREIIADPAAAPTFSAAELSSSQRTLQQLAEARGGRLEVLADGSAIVTLTAPVATDQAAQAARCALDLRALHPHRPMALATGRAEVTGKLPLGDAIDRAAQMLARLSGAPPGAYPIAIDDVTAGLLDARFEVRAGELGLELCGEREREGRARTLLGKVTPCVGREREIMNLLSLLRACAEERAARAVLVTAPAGTGKSRLVHELVRRIQQGGDETTIWIGHGDPLRVGSAFGLLGQVLRSALGIQDGGPLEARWAQIRARVGERVPEGDRDRVAAFLSEIVGAPLPEEESVLVRAARQDAQLMGDQLRRAWVDFVRAESASRPILVVLEDLHWADWPSVRSFDEALREARGEPFLVLGIARPEIYDRFPGIWGDHISERLRLAGLSRKASEQLVRQALGAGTSDETVARVVTLAEGNAFHLEELIRAVAEGKGTSLPETVLAMVEERLSSLDAEARRALRAASVFGEVFWEGGMIKLLGGEQPSALADAWLSSLVDKEMILRRPESRFSGEREFVFRHSLIREAAYAMLTEDDLRLGHRLAADWLKEAGETDAFVVAQHLDRGGDRSRAAEAYVRAGRDALEANDLDAVLARAARAEQCGAFGERLAEIRLLEATVHHWRADFAKGERAALDALWNLPPFSASWYRAAEELAETCFPLGNIDALATLAPQLHPPDESGLLESFVMAASTVANQLFLGGQHEVGASLMERIDAGERRLSEANPLVTAKSHFARATRAMVSGDLGAVLNHARRAIVAFDEAGDLRSATLMRSNLAYVYAEVGAHEQAEASLRRAIAAAERLGLPAVIAGSKQNLGLVLARMGQLEEACAVELASAELLDAINSKRMGGISRIYLSQIRTLMGDPEGGEEQAQRAISATAAIPPIRVYAQAELAQARLARGAATEALEVAREAMGALEQLGSIDEGEALVRLVYARALCEVGDTNAARGVIEKARELLLGRAAKINDPDLRESFLCQIPEHVQIMALAASLSARSDTG